MFPFNVLSEHFKDCFPSKQLWMILKNRSEAYQRNVCCAWCHERSMGNKEGRSYFGSQSEGEEIMAVGV